jgi:predicted dithiol-disulfide oxidoreductase (DUF899 family)
MPCVPPIYVASKETDVSLPTIVTRAEWLVARKALLEKEKAITR